MKFFFEKERGRIQVLPKFFEYLSIVSGTGKLRTSEFCTRIHRIDRNKSTLKISGKVAVRLKNFQGTHYYIGRIASHGHLCGSSAFLYLLVLEGVQCDSETKYGEPLIVDSCQFSRWRTNLRNHASVTLWKISLTRPKFRLIQSIFQFLSVIFKSTWVDLFSSRVKSLFIQVVDLSRLDDVPSRSRVRLQGTGDS